jgi:hypothetical protein
MYIDFDCADPDGKILGPNWPPNLCNPIPVMVEAIYVIAQRICANGGVEGNEFRHVPEGTDPADFLTYFAGGISQHALILEGYDTLWWTQNSGVLWRQANNFNFLVGEDGDFLDPADPTALELNTLYNLHVPNNAFVYVTATHSLWVNIAGTWTAYTDRSFRAGIAADFADPDNPTNPELLDLFNGLTAEHALVFNNHNSTFYYTRTYGAGWNPIIMPTAQTIVDTRVNIHALETGGDLVPGNFYRINDNTSATAGDVVLEAIDDNELSTFGYYFESLAGKWLLCVYDILSGQITRMWDTYGNDVSGTTGVNSFPWGNPNLTNNTVILTTETFDYSGNGIMLDCVIRHTNCQLANNDGTFQALDLYYGTFAAEDNSGIIETIKVRNSVVDFSQNLGTISDMRIDTSNVSMVSNGVGTNVINNEIIGAPIFAMDSFTGSVSNNHFERVNWQVTSAIGTVSDNEFFRTTMTAASFNGTMRRNHVVACTATLSSTTVAFNFDDNNVTGGTLTFTSSSGDVKFNLLDNCTITMTTLSGTFNYNQLKDTTVSANSVTGNITKNFAQNGIINAASFPGTMSDNRLSNGATIAGNTITNAGSIVSGNVIKGDANITLTNAANVTCTGNTVSAGLGLYSPDGQINLTSSTGAIVKGNIVENSAFLSLNSSTNVSASGNVVRNDSSVSLSSANGVTLTSNTFLESVTFTAVSLVNSTITRNRFSNNQTSTLTCATATALTIEYNVFELSSTLTLTTVISATIFGNTMSNGGSMSITGGSSLTVTLNTVNGGALTSAATAGGTVSRNMIDGQSTLTFTSQASTGSIDHNKLHEQSTLTCTNNAGTVTYLTLIRATITAAKNAGFNAASNVFTNIFALTLAVGADTLNLRENDIAIAVSTVTVSNNAAETSMLTGTINGFLTLPANFFTVGRTLLVKAGGFYGTAAAAPNNVVRFKLGGTTILATATDNLAAPIGNDQNWWMDLMITCRSVGAGGTVIGQGVLLYATGGSVNKPFSMKNLATVGVNTTTTLAIDFTTDFNNADVANIFNLTNFLVQYAN